MILLRRLRIHALKHLRDIDIWFPRHGSVLIEGQNESGKSTLFEAIYFALYGAPLVGEDGTPSLASLIPHGDTNVAVELALLAGETELTIHRSLSAGKRQKHDATLVVRVPGGQKEDLHTVAAVNARILQELHGLDGNALRNSCLMEQRALDRIEALSRDAREDAIARLLGLDVLRRATREFQPVQADETRLAGLRAQLEIAQSQRAARDATMREAESTERWRAAEVLHELNERDRLLAAQSDIQMETLQDAERTDSLQQRVAAAHRAEAMLSQADEIGRELATAREFGERVVALKSRASALDAQVDDRLPAALDRLTALSRLQPAFVAAQQRATLLSEAARLAREQVAGRIPSRPRRSPWTMRNARPRPHAPSRRRLLRARRWSAGCASPRALIPAMRASALTRSLPSMWLRSGSMPPLASSRVYGSCCWCLPVESRSSRCSWA